MLKSFHDDLIPVLSLWWEHIGFWSFPLENSPWSLYDHFWFLMCFDMFFMFFWRWLKGLRFSFVLIYICNWFKCQEREVQNIMVWSQMKKSCTLFITMFISKKGNSFIKGTVFAIFRLSTKALEIFICANFIQRSISYEEGLLVVDLVKKQPYILYIAFERKEFNLKSLFGFLD